MPDRSRGLSLGGGSGSEPGETAGGKPADGRQSVREPTGFRRSAVAPGGAKTGALGIAPAHLTFRDLGMERVVESGMFQGMVVDPSQDLDPQKVTLRVR